MSLSYLFNINRSMIFRSSISNSLLQRSTTIISTNTLSHVIRPSPAAPTTTVRTIMGGRPAPPPLPPKEQAEFEKLQREAAVSSAFQQYSEVLAEGSEEDVAQLNEKLARAGPNIEATAAEVLSEKQQETLLHPDFHYSNIKPDFEGDQNPVTGEIGGPKQDPLRHGDYSFNCRVTDF